MIDTRNDVATLMSVEELRAAPESDYMSARQLEYFRSLLIQERDVLLEAARQTTLHLQVYEVNADPSDCASLEEDHTLELRFRDRERKLLHKIDDALARIDSGNFGWCAETGEPIGIDRLLARPTAAYGLEVQRRLESRRKLHGR